MYCIVRYIFSSSCSKSKSNSKSRAKANQSKANPRRLWELQFHHHHLNPPPLRFLGFCFPARKNRNQTVTGNNARTVVMTFTIKKPETHSTAPQSPPLALCNKSCISGYENLWSLPCSFFNVSAAMDLFIEDRSCESWVEVEEKPHAYFISLRSLLNPPHWLYATNPASEVWESRGVGNGHTHKPSNKKLSEEEIACVIVIVIGGIMNHSIMHALSPLFSAGWGRGAGIH